MPRKKAEETAENSSENLESQAAPNDTPATIEQAPKPKKQSQKEPLKPFLLVADLGRSSCKALAYVNEKEINIDKLTSCVAQLDSSPGNDFGGFTLELEEPHPTEVNEKGKPIKVKRQEYWVVGDRAQAYPNPIWMTDKSEAKVEYFHVLLMGVISVIPHLDKLSTGKSIKQRTLTIDLATLSIAKSDELKKKLKGCKTLTVDGVKYRLNFTSNQQSFVEGHGAATSGKNQFPNHSTLYVADLGAGTFQISEFSILNKLPSKKSKDSYHGGGGITSLKREVAKALSNGDSSNYLTRSQVSTILEKSEWTSGKVVAQDFTKSDVSNQVTTAINQWLRESPAGFALEDLVNISRRSPVVFCGGGFAIASVREIIKQRIIESGGDEANLIFPDDLGLIAVKGVLDYITLKPSNILQLSPKEIQHDNTEQAATA